MEVNQSVVSGFTDFTMSGATLLIAPKYAETACLSVARQALWTNRVPEHEPWPRVMKGDTSPPPNSMNDEYTKNVHHIDQYDNVTSPAGLQPIGRVEGDEVIERGELWRR
jgi:hypothetical protein